MSTKKYLKLVIDNTLIHKVNKLLDTQKKLIRGKIHLQKEEKEIKALLSEYEDKIIMIENKLNTYRRKQNAKRNLKQTGNTRSSRNKTSNNHEGTL